MVVGLRDLVYRSWFKEARTFSLVQLNFYYGYSALETFHEKREIRRYTHSITDFYLSCLLPNMLTYT